MYIVQFMNYTVNWCTFTSFIIQFIRQINTKRKTIKRFKMLWKLFFRKLHEKFNNIDSWNTKKKELILEVKTFIFFFLL